MLKKILTNPLMSHGLFLMMSLFPFWTRTVYHTDIFNGGTESSQTKSKIS